MKKFLPFVAIFTSAILFSQTPCVNGFAGPYPCNGINLQSSISLTTMNANSGNDSWGWTDPQSGKEYALMGLSNGTAFIDISSPTSPIYLGKLPTHTDPSSWRDIKVYNNYAFVVSEASGHGMQVFDLTRLRNVTNPPINFTEDAHYNGFGNCHNIVINEDSGFAYAVGTQTFNGGPHFINIQDPLNPVAAGGFAMDDYSHDAQVVTYCGPDSDYVGKEILIGSNETEISIVDITDKANPIGISTISYPNVGYTHQGWFTQNQQYFILGDEIDELNIGGNTRTIIFDFTDLDNPQEHFEYFGPTPAIDHNGYTNGNRFYMANYRAGMRVINVSDIANQNIAEVASFDTYPSNNNASFDGAWSVYPYFASGNIVISDINRGFFLVRAQNHDQINPVAVCQNITVSLDINGMASVAPEAINNGSSDNSGSVDFILCERNFDCSQLGENTVTLEVYDDFGNTATCTAIITIVDSLAPQITCPDALAVGYDNGGSAYTLPNYITNGNVIATDNCSFSSVQDPIAGTQLTNGTYTITTTVTDSSGNATNCSFQLTVDSALSVEDLNLNNSLVVYPNPAFNIITITSKNNRDINELQIFDVLGNKIITQQSFSDEAKIIDVSQLSNGLYFLVINNQITKKIIKK